MKDTITHVEALDYEVQSSLWAGWVSWKWGQELAAKYYAAKVKRKVGRINARKARLQEIYDDMQMKARMKAHLEAVAPLVNEKPEEGCICRGFYMPPNCPLHGRMQKR